jgi:hypothetical protein
MDKATAAAAILDSLPPRSEVQAIEDSISTTGMLPGSTQAMLDRLQATMDTCTRVLTYANTPDGKIDPQPSNGAAGCGHAPKVPRDSLKLSGRFDALQAGRPIGCGSAPRRRSRPQSPNARPLFLHPGRVCRRRPPPAHCPMARVRGRDLWERAQCASARALGPLLPEPASSGPMAAVGPEVGCR